jgi:uncharacterized protein (TIGR02246 family)
MAADERQIRELHSTWIDAVNAGDLTRLLILVADDVVFLNPGQEPFGLAGFSANFSAAQRQIRQPDGRWLLARDAHALSPVEE